MVPDTEQPLEKHKAGSSKRLEDGAGGGLCPGRAQKEPTQLLTRRKGPMSTSPSVVSGRQR